MQKQEDTYKIVGYYTNWSQYREGPYKFVPEDIDPTLFTHINFAFAKIDSSFCLQPVEWNDINEYNQAQGMYYRLNALKLKHKHLRTLISIGGWNFNSNADTRHLFSCMVASKQHRSTFINSAMHFVRLHGFDGIDIDWEYPACPDRGGKTEDTENFSILLAEFREAIESESLAVGEGHQRMLLTIAAPAGHDKFSLLQLDRIHKSLDWINIMTYDLHGSWDNTTGSHTALYPSFEGDALNVDSVVSSYIKSGVPPHKIVVGLATYARTWTLQYPGIKTGMGAPAQGAAPAGAVTKEAGFYSNFEIKSLLSDGATLCVDAKTQSAYMVKGSIWASFDTAETMRLKVKYITAKQLGGAMVWSIDLDDRNELLRVIHCNLTN